MTRTLLSGLLLVLLLAVPAFATPGTALHFTGRIGADIPVQLKLAFTADSPVSGTLTYERFGVPIPLDGTFTDSEGFCLSERPYDRATGTENTTGMLSLRFTVAGDTQLTGTWRSPAGNREFPVVFTRTAGYRTLHFREGENIVISTTYPVCENPAAQRFNRDFDHQQRLWFDAAITDMRTEQQSALEGHYPFRLTAEADYRIVYQSAHLLSLYGTIYRYGGGAHGLSEFVNENYQITARKAEPFALADLFTPGSAWVDRLSALCLAELRVQQASSVMDSAVTSFTADDLGSFTVSPAGLSINFPPYAVGSYAEGDFAVIIPWSKISGLIRRDGPAAEFLP